MTKNLKRIEQARELLKIIETVDHLDTVDMAEINARWWCLTVNEQFISFKQNIENSALGDCICINFYHPDAGHGNGFVTLRDFYATSRDALKAARPEGWLIKAVCQWHSGCTYQLSHGFKAVRGLENKQVYSPILPTECLAEFHAIVQAWIYVWENEA